MYRTDAAMFCIQGECHAETCNKLCGSKSFAYGRCTGPRAVKSKERKKSKKKDREPRREGDSRKQGGTEEKEREERKELAGAAGSAATVARHCRRRAKRHRVSTAVPPRMRRDASEGEKVRGGERERSLARGVGAVFRRHDVRSHHRASSLAVVVLGTTSCHRRWG
ncbi:uncharacterized protein DS421_10g296490 [Arachis hypogaea]|nr:uncharacterized protein DS421_10g296490 [Arachis hypogaea]